MAVIIDKGEANDIHPKDKQAVGHRLALIARAKTYGERIPYSGPMYHSYEIDGDKIILSFDHTEGGLKSGDGKTLQGFSIAGRDHKFHWAKAEIQGDKIVVSSPKYHIPLLFAMHGPIIRFVICIMVQVFQLRLSVQMTGKE